MDTLPPPVLNLSPLDLFGQRVRTAPLTLDEMRAIILRGESVLWNGHVISSLAQLPSQAQLAVGDPEAEAAAAAELQSRIDRLNSELSALKAGTLARPEVFTAAQTMLKATPPDAGNPVTTGPPAPGSVLGPADVLTEAQRADMKRVQREALVRSKDVAANADPKQPPPVSGKNVP